MVYLNDLTQSPSPQKEQSKLLGDYRKEKGRLTKWERKEQSFERKSSLRF